MSPKFSCQFLGIFLLASCTTPDYSRNYEYRRPVNYVPATSILPREVSNKKAEENSSAFFLFNKCL
ncbi:MAG: hypothetical protein J6M05_06140 [Cardiobacteriaceae bacterium]|nr:hypothetical protein [Cardiobacteriaceae bacterium]